MNPSLTISMWTVPVAADETKTKHMSDPGYGTLTGRGMPQDGDTYPSHGREIEGGPQPGISLACDRARPSSRFAAAAALKPSTVAPVGLSGIASSQTAHVLTTATESRSKKTARLSYAHLQQKQQSFIVGGSSDADQEREPHQAQHLPSEPRRGIAPITSGPCHPLRALGQF
jgi:hypothetical protein